MMMLFAQMFCYFSGNWDFSVVHDRRSLYQSRSHSEWVTITPLIPMSTYTIQVNASNTVGFILSNVLTENLPPGCKFEQQDSYLLIHFELKVSLNFVNKVFSVALYLNHLTGIYKIPVFFMTYKIYIFSSLISCVLLLAHGFSHMNNKIL